MALPNETDVVREVMTMIWFADGARVTEPKDQDQSVLFRYLLDRRHDRPAQRTGLAMIDAAATLDAPKSECTDRSMRHSSVIP